MLRLLAIVVVAATLFAAGTARAARSFTVLPPPEVLQAMPAYRYAGMTSEQAYGELDRRKVPYRKVGPVGGVRAPVRLTGELHGVHVHSALPEDERAESVFEILDARLALALDDFAALLERHDIVEVVHFTMYRPNLPRPDAAGPTGDAARDSPARAGKGSERTTATGASRDVGSKGLVGPGKGRNDGRHPHKQKSASEQDSGQKLEPKTTRTKAAAKKAEEPASKPVDKPRGKPVDKHPGKRAGEPAGKPVDKPPGKRAASGKHLPADKHGRRSPAGKRPPSAKPDPTPPAPAEPPKKHVSWAPPGTRHPAGLAIDVGGVRKRDGRWLSVAHHFGGRIGAQTCGPGAAPPASIEARELWSIVCEVGDLGLFTYVLTPNYDEPHADHFHMEIKPAVRWVLFH